MRFAPLALLLLSIVLITACSKAPVQGCTEEAKICPDGTAVGRTGPNCEFAACPEPTAPQQAVVEEVDEVVKDYKGDPDQCMHMKFACPEGSELFTDQNGCGCKTSVTRFVIKQHDTNDGCTKEYLPVCGSFTETCTTASCRQTFSNKCAATQDEDVVSYVEGVCPDPQPAHAVTQCKDPRPEICTLQYDPVCGTRSDGTTSTYSNGCSACADEKVTSYIDNQCSGVDNRWYAAHSPETCAATDWICDEGKQQFFDETGCGCEDAEAPAKPVVQGELSQCDTANHPTACNKAFEPVCGDNGKNYGNPCSACSQKDVNAYSAGRCGAEQPDSDTEPTTPSTTSTIKSKNSCGLERPTVCGEIYQPVCGHTMSSSRTYENPCSACADTDVTYWYADACPN